jgi:hypothetical protein
MNRVSIAFGTHKDNRLANRQKRINIFEELEFTTLVALAVYPKLFDDIKNLWWENASQSGF